MSKKTPSNPVIVIPGITASSLRDEYPVSPDTVWSAVLNKSYARITLHPDDLRYELLEPARVRESAVFPVPYRELILELRHDLTDKADEPVPVFPFAYDWRQPLEVAEARLSDFVQEVIDRTRLLKHYDRSPWRDAPRVDLVGHSMGGLILAGYLEARGSEAPIDKVATLATPFQGSYESVVKVLTGTGSLSPLEPRSREREAARLTPALYHLLPSFEEAVTDEVSGAAIDLYEVNAWQPGVLSTLAEFIRQFGLEAGRSQQKRLLEARELLEQLLTGARAHRRRVDSLRLSEEGVSRHDWLAIVGVDSKTRVRLQLGREGGKPHYHLRKKDRLNQWGSAQDGEQTGDGTVPFRGACPRFLPKSDLVCLAPGDLEYWEVGDRALNSVVGWHGTLPKANVAHRLIVKHLRGERADSTVFGRPAPGLSSEQWTPPIQGLTPP